MSLFDDEESFFGSRSRRRCTEERPSYLEPSDIPIQDFEVENIQNGHAEANDVEEEIDINIFEYLQNNPQLADAALENQVDHAADESHSQFRVRALDTGPITIPIDEPEESSPHASTSNSSLHSALSNLFIGADEIATNTKPLTKLGHTESMSKKDFESASIETFGKFPIVQCEKLDVELLKKNSVKICNSPAVSSGSSDAHTGIRKLKLVSTPPNIVGRKTIVIRPSQNNSQNRVFKNESQLNLGNRLIKPGQSQILRDLKPQTIYTLVKAGNSMSSDNVVDSKGIFTKKRVKYQVKQMKPAKGTGEFFDSSDIPIESETVITNFPDIHSKSLMEPFSKSSKEKRIFSNASVISINHPLIMQDGVVNFKDEKFMLPKTKPKIVQLGKYNKLGIQRSKSTDRERKSTKERRDSTFTPTNDFDQIQQPNSGDIGGEEKNDNGVSQRPLWSDIMYNTMFSVPNTDECSFFDLDSYEDGSAANVTTEYEMDLPSSSQNEKTSVSKLNVDDEYLSDELNVEDSPLKNSHNNVGKSSRHKSKKLERSRKSKTKSHADNESDLVSAQIQDLAIDNSNQSDVSSMSISNDSNSNIKIKIEKTAVRRNSGTKVKSEPTETKSTKNSENLVRKDRSRKKSSRFYEPSTSNSECVYDPQKKIKKEPVDPGYNDSSSVNLPQSSKPSTHDSDYALDPNNEISEGLSNPGSLSPEIEEQNQHLSNKVTEQRRSKKKFRQSKNDKRLFVSLPIPTRDVPPKAPKKKSIVVEDTATQSSSVQDDLNLFSGRRSLRNTRRFSMRNMFNEQSTIPIRTSSIGGKKLTSDLMEDAERCKKIENKLGEEINDFSLSDPGFTRNTSVTLEKQSSSTSELDFLSADNISAEQKDEVKVHGEERHQKNLLTEISNKNSAKKNVKNKRREKKKIFYPYGSQIVLPKENPVVTSLNSTELIQHVDTKSIIQTVGNNNLEPIKFDVVTTSIEESVKLLENVESFTDSTKVLASAVESMESDHPVQLLDDVDQSLGVVDPADISLESANPIDPSQELAEFADKLLESTELADQTFESSDQSFDFDALVNESLKSAKPVLLESDVDFHKSPKSIECVDKLPESTQPIDKSLESAKTVEKSPEFADKLPESAEPVIQSSQKSGDEIQTQDFSLLSEKVTSNESSSNKLKLKLKLGLSKKTKGKADKNIFTVQVEETIANVEDHKILENEKTFKISANEKTNKTPAKEKSVKITTKQKTDKTAAEVKATKSSAKEKSSKTLSKEKTPVKGKIPAKEKTSAKEIASRELVKSEANKKSVKDKVKTSAKDKMTTKTPAKEKMSSSQNKSKTAVVNKIEKDPLTTPKSQVKKRPANFLIEDILLPLQKGWLREMVHRATEPSAGRRLSDIYYHAPNPAKKLRSMVEIGTYLLQHPEIDLTLKNFTFCKDLVSDHPNETERSAATSGRTPNASKGTPKSAPKPKTKPDKSTPVPKIKLEKPIPNLKIKLNNSSSSDKPAKKPKLSLPTPKIKQEKPDEEEILSVKPQRSRSKRSFSPDEFLTEVAPSPVIVRANKRTIRRVIPFDNSEAEPAFKRTKKSLPSSLEGPSTSKGKSSTSQKTVKKTSIEDDLLLLLNTPHEQTAVKEEKVDPVSGKVENRQDPPVEASKSTTACPVPMKQGTYSGLNSVVGRCSSRCSVAVRQYPSVQCVICFCLFHEKCIPKLAKGKAFTCRLCQIQFVDDYVQKRKSKIETLNCGNSKPPTDELDFESVDIEMENLSPEVVLKADVQNAYGPPIIRLQGPNTAPLQPGVYQFTPNATKTTTPAPLPVNSAVSSIPSSPLNVSPVYPSGYIIRLPEGSQGPATVPSQGPGCALPRSPFVLSNFITAPSTPTSSTTTTIINSVTRLPLPPLVSGQQNVMRIPLPRGVPTTSSFYVKRNGHLYLITPRCAAVSNPIVRPTLDSNTQATFVPLPASALIGTDPIASSSSNLDHSGSKALPHCGVKLASAWSEVEKENASYSSDDDDSEIVISSSSDSDDSDSVIEDLNDSEDKDSDDNKKKSDSDEDSSDENESNIIDEHSQSAAKKEEPEGTKVDIWKVLAVQSVRKLIFDAFSIWDLLQILQVNKRMNQYSSEKYLWNTVSSGNLKITDWERCFQFLKKHNTKTLDLSGFTFDETATNPWEDFEKNLSIPNELKELSMRGLSPSVIKSISSHLPALTCLECHCVTTSLSNIWETDCNLELAPLHGLGRLVSLSIGTLGSITLGSGSEYFFPYMPNLKHVSFTGFKFHSQANLENLAQLKELETLELGNIGDVEPGIYRVLARLAKLTHLRLENGGKLSDTKLCTALANMKKLESLDLMNYQIPNNLAECLSNLKNLTNFTIWPNCKSEGEIVLHNAIKSIKACKNLEKLIFGLLHDQEDAPAVIYSKEPKKNTRKKYKMKEICDSIKRWTKKDCHFEIRCLPSDQWKNYCHSEDDRLLSDQFGSE